MSAHAIMRDLVRALGRGPGRARHLTREEAAAAMACMLSGDAPPEATGALLMLMRYRGEEAGEIAGFVDALRARAPGWAECGATVDWPSYAAGRSRGAPLFLAAAALLANAGERVLIHGWNAASTVVLDAAAAMDVPIVRTPDAARLALATKGLAYAPLADLDLDALRLMRLRDVLGLRSPINTALRAFNPTMAETALQGVFHPSYRGLQQDAAALLGQPRLMTLKGGGGEFERHPAKTVALLGLGPTGSFSINASPLIDDRRRLADAATVSPSALWRGEVEDAFGAAVVIGTAAAALFAAGRAETHAEAEIAARDLWRSRRQRLAA